MALTPAELKSILQNSPGLFKAVPGSTILASLQTQRNQFENKLPATAPNTDRIRISKMVENIGQYPADFTHLSISLANNQLTDSAEQVRLHLVMIGTKLNVADDVDVNNPILQISPTQFSNLNANPMLASEIATDHRRFRRRFKNRFRMQFANQKIVHGMYIKLAALRAMLTELSAEQMTHLRISFGFMEAITPDDWNCIHVIFRGFNPDTNVTSTNTWSTFDGIPGYSGPKPGCPPFDEPDGEEAASAA